MKTELCEEGRALVERVSAIVPELASAAREGEQLRRIPDASWKAIEETGVFRMMVPRALGGLELDLDTFVEVGLTIAAADVSTAWVTNFLVEHNWMFCQFPEAFQNELFESADYVLAPAAVAPSGRAEKVDGGYRLSGRWSWGTGVMHSTWVIVGAIVEGEGVFFFALPREDVEVDDTWDVAGMQATGSHDMVVPDVVVPESRAVSIIDMSAGCAHGATLHEGPLYRTPMIPILTLAASMPLVGHAVEVVRRYRERLGERTRMMSPKKAKETPPAQMRLARVETEVRQAELLLREVAREVMALRDEATIEDRARWGASIAHAVHQARRVIGDVAEGSGASAQFNSDPLQRALRDVNVASCHIVFDLDAQRERYGRVMLGLDPGAGPF